ncbi:MAG: IS21-like element helper ATPase IstB [Lachnospiraceae bacterium]|nr:IS21-like element helper ATPase IstB [Lachnospiraceae bacterium]
MKTIKLTSEDIKLIERLKQMKMSGLAEAYEEQVKNPNSDLTGFYDRFSNIVNHEWELRFNKKFNRYLKKATLRYPQASFDDSIYEPDRMLDTETIELLSTCKWLDDGRNLLITGATGAGKSYISNALCIAAIRQFKTVKYIRANTMMSEMDQARIKGTYLDYVKGMSQLDMLVVDDFGLMDLDIDKCRDFFEVIDSRDNRKSTVVVSQLPVKSWYDLFADNTYADACLDRIVHRAFRLELNGKNMRNPA